MMLKEDLLDLSGTLVRPKLYIILN
jgi:hypothetical protein